MTERKMKGKQEVVGGFNLDQFVQGSESEEAPTASKPTRPKPEKPLLVERAQVKLTKTEMAILKDKAGLVPVSVFLRTYLQHQGFFDPD